MSEGVAATGEWWLYVVETAAGRLYTGITTDVERRFGEHCAGKRGARALRGKGPLTLRFSTRVGDRSTALKREYAFKQLARSDKLAVVEGRQWLEEVLGVGK